MTQVELGGKEENRTVKKQFKTQVGGTELGRDTQVCEKLVKEKDFLTQKAQLQLQEESNENFIKAVQVSHAGRRMKTQNHQLVF